MKALLVAPVARPGGAERALAAVAERLPGLGIEVTAVLFEDGPLRGWLRCPVDVVEVPRLRYPAGVARSARALRPHVEAVDVVLANHPRGHVVAGAAARLAGRPSVLWQHGLAGRSPLDAAAALVPAAAIVCVSQAAAAAQRRLPGGRKVTVVHPGIDVAAVRARVGAGAEVRHRLGWDEVPVVGIVARLQPWKGQDVFLRAAARLPGARFLVVGGAVLGREGTYPDDLRRLAADLGLGDRTHFAGHQDDAVPWIDACDVVVSASADEPFGLVIVEAMALGKVVVATAGGGPLEILTPGSGLLVPHGDPHALATTVAGVLADPALAAELAAGARARAEVFTADRMAEGMAAVLRAAAGR